MKVTSRVHNERGRREITLVTNGKPHTISIPPGDSGLGSKANGGELLVEVEVTGDFGGPGDPARNVTYRAKVTAQGSQQEIHDLMIHTDQVAEVHNSLRQGTQVTLRHVEPEPVAKL